MTFKVKDSWKAVWCSTAISPGHLKLILLLVETQPLSLASLPKSCRKKHDISVLKTFEDPVLGLSIMIYVPRVPCKTILDLFDSFLHVNICLHSLVSKYWLGWHALWQAPLILSTGRVSIMLIISSLVVSIINIFLIDICTVDYLPEQSQLRVILDLSTLLTY